MEGISLKHLTCAVQSSFPMRWHLTSALSESIPRVYLHRKVSLQALHSRFIPAAKGYPFQDFQGFAKPLQLLPATQVNICKDSLMEETSALFEEDRPLALYIVHLQTSSDFGSSLSDLNAAILLCMIDVNGDSILQRMPITTLEHTGDSKGTIDSDSLCFQRGSVDKIVLKGPRLWEIEALWIGLESGCWRLGGVKLTVVCPRKLLSNSSEYVVQNQYSGQHYEFETSEILLGEGEGMSMAELKPTLVTEVDSVDFCTLLNMGFSQSASPTDNKMSNEESMKEYADLKLSLLLYDAILIFIGTSITAFSIDEKAANAFLIGGASGFLYLLLLQKSVDGLPTPSLSAMANKKEDLRQVFGGFKGPLSSIALALTLSIIAVKYGLGSPSLVLTPGELLAGVAGFLSCKIAVVLAAFNPMQTGTKEDN